MLEQRIVEVCSIEASSILWKVKEVDQFLILIDQANDETKNDDGHLNQPKRHRTLRCDSSNKSPPSGFAFVLNDPVEIKEVLEAAFATVCQRPWVRAAGPPAVQAIAVHPFRGAVAQTRFDEVAAVFVADAALSLAAFHSHRNARRRLHSACRMTLAHSSNQDARD